MESNDRLHALDAVRAFALFLGIVLHATMSFFLPIPASDNSPSTALGVTFFVIHMFRMSLFYVIAGFFAHLVFHRKGFAVFARERAGRIAMPMVVGWLILSPVLGIIMIWGLTRTYGAETLATMEAPTMGLPLTHLWFLYYLCLFYVFALALRYVFVQVDRAGRLRGAIDRVLALVLPTPLAPIMLALPAATYFYFSESWMPWMGIPTPDYGLTPQAPALIAYGTAFTLGWLLHRQTSLLVEWKKRWQLNLAVAVVLTVGCLRLVGLAPVMEPVFGTDAPGWHKLVYTAGYCMATWFWTFGVIGAALQFFSKASDLQRYLADASYWLYLAHLPVVFLLQVLLMNVNLHWSFKFPLILLVTMTVLLVSYHYMVRSTFIGKALNGRKYPRKSGITEAPEEPSSTKPSGGGNKPVAALRGVTHHYGTTTALDSVSLNVEHGELLAVLGPNGAGKSTAISLWLGMLEPDEGTVDLMGRSPLEVENRLEIGVMMQEVSLAPELRAREQIELTASYYPNPLPVDEVIALTGIEELANKRYTTMSTGQKRQMQFATAICGRPKLLFLDEPTVGLDIKSRENMWKLIQRLLEQGCSIVLTTHYLEEAEALADRVAVLAKGKLIALGSVDEVRAIVTRRQIKCVSTTSIDEIKSWPGVVSAFREEKAVQLSVVDAEAVVRRLLNADSNLSQLEVKPASLAEAFSTLTEEAA